MSEGSWFAYLMAIVIGVLIVVAMILGGLKLLGLL